MQTLKKRQDFQRVQRGRKWVTPAFVLHGLRRAEVDDGEEPRFGFTVSSKSVAVMGPGGKKRGTAVDRNRARRRLKEAVRLTAETNANQHFDYVVIGRAAALHRNFAVLLEDMQAAFHNLQRPENTARRSTG